MTATILVVDDELDLEPLVLQKFRKQIRDGTVRFMFAHDGIEALRSIEQHPQVDMVVSDINMPGMSGLELLPVVRERRPKLPVFMISAYGDSATVATALERGAKKFLTKPVNFPQLKEDVLAAMADARGGA